MQTQMFSHFASILVCCTYVSLLCLFFRMNNSLFQKIVPCMRPKKKVLFPEIDQVKTFLSLTRPHSQMFIRIYIFNFKKQTNKQKK